MTEFSSQHFKPVLGRVTNRVPARCGNASPCCGGQGARCGNASPYCGGQEKSPYCGAYKRKITNIFANHRPFPSVFLFFLNLPRLTSLTFLYLYQHFCTFNLIEFVSTFLKSKFIREG